MENIATLISTLGFPMAACVVMFWQNGKLQKTLSDLSTTLTLMNERINDIKKEETNGNTNRSK